MLLIYRYVGINKAFLITYYKNDLFLFSFLFYINMKENNKIKKNSIIDIILYALLGALAVSSFSLFLFYLTVNNRVVDKSLNHA
jgi:hypothetical protein